jgi:hypothetical protein
MTHEVEVKRLRAEFREQTTSDHEEPASMMPDSTTTSEGRVPLTAEPGKRGPRVARDTL